MKKPLASKVDEERQKSRNLGAAPPIQDLLKVARLSCFRSLAVEGKEASRIRRVMLITTRYLLFITLQSLLAYLYVMTPRTIDVSKG